MKRLHLNNFTSGFLYILAAVASLVGAIMLSIWVAVCIPDYGIHSILAPPYFILFCGLLGYILLMVKGIKKTFERENSGESEQTSVNGGKGL